MSAGSDPNAAVIRIRVTWVTGLCAKYAIKSERTRHSCLVKLVGAMFDYASRDVALKAASQLYDEANLKPRTPKHDHLADFAGIWAWTEKQWLKKRSGTERKLYSSLGCETLRAAFRLYCSYIRYSGPQFFVHRNTLAAHLGVGPSRATKYTEAVL